MLGADDNTAVAVLLELIYTVGDEAGCVGAVQLDKGLVKAKMTLVFDWVGCVNTVITQSPPFCKIGVKYLGRSVHPAHWQHGRNAGTRLFVAAGNVSQGEYVPGVTCSIGQVRVGDARSRHSPDEAAGLQHSAGSARRP